MNLSYLEYAAHVNRIIAIKRNTHFFSKQNKKRIKNSDHDNDNDDDDNKKRIKRRNNQQIRDSIDVIYEFKLLFHSYFSSSL